MARYLEVIILAATVLINVEGSKIPLMSENNTSETTLTGQSIQMIPISMRKDVTHQESSEFNAVTTTSYPVFSKTNEANKHTSTLRTTFHNKTDASTRISPLQAILQNKSDTSRQTSTLQTSTRKYNVHDDVYKEIRTNALTSTLQSQKLSTNTKNDTQINNKTISNVLHFAVENIPQNQITKSSSIARQIYFDIAHQNKDKAIIDRVLTKSSSDSPHKNITVDKANSESINREHNKTLRYSQNLPGTSVQEELENVARLSSSKATGDSLAVKYKVNQVKSKCECEHNICDCTYLELTSVPDHLPTTITELLLNNNQITTLPDFALSRYSRLEKLVISNNKIAVLEINSLNGLALLTYLDISNNEINREEHLPAEIFQPLKSLTVLKMHSNILQCPKRPLPLDTALSYLHNLQKLYLDNYVDSDDKDGFGPGWKNMSSLRYVVFDCNTCKMDNLRNSTFRNLAHIKSLSLRNCDLYGGFIETDTFIPFRHLDTLDISENPHLGLDYLSIILLGLPTLQTLIINNIVDLNQYSLTNIDSSLTEILPRTLTSLVARRNNILSIDKNAVRKLPKTLKTVDISENKIFMNPDYIPLEEMKELETLVINNNFEGCSTESENTRFDSTSGKLMCQGNINCRRRTLERDGTMKLGSRIPWTLKSVKIMIQDMHEDYFSHIDNHNNLQELDLSCSYLPELYFTSFETLPNLRFLNVQRSSVKSLIIFPEQIVYSLKSLILAENNLNDFFTYFLNPFYYLPNLSFLDISLNQLNNLPSETFLGLDNLEHLRLDRNILTNFDVNISYLHKLKFLNFSSTQLSYLSFDIRSHIDQLCKHNSCQIRVDMSECPLQCDCFNLNFLKWMVNSAAFDKKFKGYKCKYPDTSFKYITDSFQETIVVLNRECAENYYMFLIVLVATSGLLFAVIGSIIYRFRWKIRYLYYAAYLKVMDNQKDKEGHQFKYDVFIAYDSEDQRFVTNHLSPELEKRGLKLLIHGRDFVAGTYIASNVVMAVTESRKTLVVLTRNLLESTWCNYEIQMATMEAVHTGRQVLVFLLKENIPSRELDVELQRYIHKNTYLPYPSPEEEEDNMLMTKFYDKLERDLKY